MSDDFKLTSAEWRYQRIQAEKQQAIATLMSAEAENDYDTGMLQIQTLANLRAEERNLVSMVNEHTASQNPQQSQQRSSPVDLSPAEAMKVCGLDPNKPEDVQTYVNGQQKLAAYKAAGHYRD